MILATIKKIHEKQLPWQTPTCFFLVMESWSLDKGTGSAPSLTLNSIPVVRQPIQQSWYHHPC